MAMEDWTRDIEEDLGVRVEHWDYSAYLKPLPELKLTPIRLVDVDDLDDLPD